MIRPHVRWEGRYSTDGGRSWCDWFPVGDTNQDDFLDLIVETGTVTGPNDDPYWTEVTPDGVVVRSSTLGYEEALHEWRERDTVLSMSDQEVPTYTFRRTTEQVALSIIVPEDYNAEAVASLTAMVQETVQDITSAICAGITGHITWPSAGKRHDMRIVDDAGNELAHHEMGKPRPSMEEALSALFHELDEEDAL